MSMSIDHVPDFSSPIGRSDLVEIPLVGAVFIIIPMRHRLLGGIRTMGPMLLTRKQAIMDKAIPQQMQLMIENGYIPAWEVFKRSTGWLETVDNLQLTAEDRDDYQRMWNDKLEQFAKRGARH